MRLHQQDKQALSVLAIMAMISHLILAAICAGPGGASFGTDAETGESYVIICTLNGTTRVPLAEYLAGGRTGAAMANGAGSTCAHCAMGPAIGLAAIALMLLSIGWPLSRARESVSVSILKALRAVAVRGPPQSFA